LLKVGRLAQRIRAARSTSSVGAGECEISWIFDPAHRVWRHTDGRTRVLSEREARLFRVLCAEPGRVFSRAQLQQAVFDKPDAVTERTVDALVGRLRRKLEDNPSRPRLLLSVYGSGYRLDPDC